MVIDVHSNYSQITQQEILNCRIAKNDIKSLTWENYWYITYQQALAWDVGHNNLAARGSGKRRRAFLSTVSGIGTSKESGNASNGRVGKVEAYELLQLDQRKRNIIPEDEKLPSYIWKELIQNPEDRKIWSQISSEGKKRIVQSIPKDEPTKNQHVMKALTREIMSEVFAAKISVGKPMNDGDTVQSSDASTFNKHDYIINKNWSKQGCKQLGEGI